MTRYGYTLMTEQSDPRSLVRYASGAERAGFDFEVMSDHYFPWLDEQGHAGYAWSMLGAVSQVDRAGRADDLRDLPDPALPPRGRRPEGRHDRPAQRRPVHPRAGRRREPQRARRRPRLAPGQRPPRHARGGGAHHPRAPRRRLRQPGRRALPGRLGQAVGPPRGRRADRGRGLRRAVGLEVRPAGRPPGRGRAAVVPGRVLGRGPRRGVPQDRAAAGVAGRRTRTPRCAPRTSSSAGSPAAGR